MVQSFSHHAKVNYLDVFGVTKVNKWQINFAGIKILVTKSLNKFGQLFLVCYQKDESKNNALSSGFISKWCISNWFIS